MTRSVRLRNSSGGLSTAQRLPQRLQQHPHHAHRKGLSTLGDGASSRPRKQGPSLPAGSRDVPGRFSGVFTVAPLSPGLPQPGHTRPHTTVPLGRSPSHHPTSCPQTWASDTRWRAQPPEAENIGSFPENLYSLQRFPESLLYLITQISKPAGTEVR